MTGDEITSRVADLTSELVRIPSEAGKDDVGPILGFMTRRMLESGLHPTTLRDERANEVGVYARLGPGDGRGPRLCLNACLDTAPVGDASRWTFPPFAAARSGGWLYGRGAADSKAACALFLALAEEFRRDGSPRRGTLDLLFDADEHSGKFGGIRAYIREAGHPDAVAIGYPGDERIMVGARGFLRAVVTTRGRAQHSGSRGRGAANAVVWMSAVVSALDAWEPPPESAPDFAFGPKLSITAISGGQGFSQIPDVCTCNVDVRLTPGFDARAAREVVGRIVRDAAPDSDIAWLENWPAYRLPEDQPFVGALRRAAREHLHREPTTAVAGASNIGNYLATLGIPAICGFGVAYENLHAADERIRLDSIGPVYRTYRDAVRRYVDGD